VKADLEKQLHDALEHIEILQEKKAQL